MLNTPSVFTNILKGQNILYSKQDRDCPFGSNGPMHISSFIFLYTVFLFSFGVVVFFVCLKKKFLFFIPLIFFFFFFFCFWFAVTDNHRGVLKTRLLKNCNPVSVKLKAAILLMKFHIRGVFQPILLFFSEQLLYNTC